MLIVSCALLLLLLFPCYCAHCNHVPPTLHDHTGKPIASLAFDPSGTVLVVTAGHKVRPWACVALAPGQRAVCLRMQSWGSVHPSSAHCSAQTASAQHTALPIICCQMDLSLHATRLFSANARPLHPPAHNIPHRLHTLSRSSTPGSTGKRRCQ